MLRRAALVISALLLLIAVVAGALYLGRVPVVQALLDSRIAALDLPEARVTVVEVELDRFRLRDLAAGSNGEFAADELRVDFRLRDLLDGNANRIEVDGLALRLDLREGATRLGSLQAFADRMAARPPRRAPGPPARLPEILVAGARINAETPFGPASLGVEGNVTYHDPRIATSNFDFVLEAPFGRLEARLGGGGDPRLRFDGDIEISGRDFEFPAAAVRLSSLNSRTRIIIANGRPYSGNGRFIFSNPSIAGTTFRGIGFDIELTETRAATRGRIYEGLDGFRLDFDGVLENLHDEPRLTLTLSSEIFEPSVLWTLARPGWPNDGNGRASATIEGGLAPRASLPRDLASLTAWLGGGGLKGVFDIDLPRLGFDGSDLELSATLRGAADWSEERLEVSLTEDGVMRATGLAADDLATRLAALGLLPPLTAQLAALAGESLVANLASEGTRPARVVLHSDALTIEGTAELTGDRLNAAVAGELSVTAEARGLDRIALETFSLEAAEVSIAGQTVDELALQGTLEGRPDDLEAKAELRTRLRRPSLGEWRAGQTRLTLPLTVTRKNGRLEAALTAPGQVVAEGLRGPGGLEVVDAVDLALEEATFAMEPADDGFVYRHQGRLAAAPVRFRLPRADAEPLTIAARLPEISWTGEGRRLEATLANGKIDLPDLQVAMDGLAATARLPQDAKPMTADFAVAAIRHLGEPLAFAPFSLSGRGVHDGKSVVLTAEGHGPGDLGRIEITGHHDMTTGTGTLDIALPPLIFSPDGAQPAQLLPLLSELNQVRGTAAGQARLHWDSQGAGSAADLSLADLSFKAGDTAVEGLDLTLRLAPLWPPTSPAGQRLTIETIDAALPLRDLAVSFSLPAGPPGQIFLEQVGFAAAGANFAVRETLIDPTASRNRARLLVEDLDLTALFESLAVEGLSGEGRLSGAIPLVLADGNLTIEAARLSSEAPGLLRFSSDAATQALQSGGEYVALMLQALENFQYDSLALTADLGADDEARLKLEMLGRNPEVLDGHPFQINIDLTGNVGPLAEALRQGHAITRDLLRRSWRLAP